MVSMKRCPHATKNPYNKLQPCYPHESTCLVAETLMHGPFKTWGGKKPFWWSISPFYSVPKIGEDLSLPFSKFLKIVVACETQHQAHHVLYHIDLLEYAGESTISP